AVSGAVLPGAETAMGQLLGRAASVGAGSMAEGAFYGAGNVIHENALGDPNLTAQSAIAQIGMSALLGGGLGVAFGAGEVALPKILSKAKEAAENLSPRLMDAYVSASSRVTGLTAEETRDIVSSGWKKKLLTPELAKKMSDGFQELHDGTE